MSPTSASFELERFSVTPVTDDTVLLELEGVLVDVPPRSAPPRLLVEGTRRNRHERDALEVELDADRLRASFIVPAADAETAGFALAVGGLLLELPAPDPSPGGDRTVALARELNGSRRQLARFRTQLEEQAEVARGHADELARARDEAAAQAEEREQAAEERAAAAERAAGEREAESEARAAEVAQEASARQSELETSCAQLEGVLADVRASAEQRDAAAADERRRLEAELVVTREEAAAARSASAVADARAEEAEDEGRTARSELELAQRALEGRDAELARSPDRRARAVARPRTVAALAQEPVDAGEPAAAAAPEEGIDTPSPGEPDAASLGAAADDVGPEADGQPTAPFVPGDTATLGDADGGVLIFGDDDATVRVDDADAPDDDDAAAAVSAEDEGDPVPDDGEADVTATHAAVPTERVEPKLPEDTGPIPLRRSSERRYVPRSDRDEEIGGDAVRVPGRDRPRASALPPPPDGDPGPPALPFGLTARALVIAVFALAALLVLVAILGYVF